MTDIFFSYRSADRERVRPVRDAFASLGFEVFWDQQVPAGVDWDTWIRRHLAQSKCAIVFWSMNSVIVRRRRGLSEPSLGCLNSTSAYRRNRWMASCVLIESM